MPPCDRRKRCILHSKAKSAGTNDCDSCLQAELQELRVGEAIERIPARPNQRIPYENTTKRPPPLKPDPFEGTWEVLTTDEGGRPFLDRHDSWAWTGPNRPGPGSLGKGLFGQQ